MNINFSSFINSTSYGIVSINLFKELVRQGHEVALWPLPSTRYIEADEDLHGILKAAIDRQAFYDAEAPSFRHYHQWDMAQHIGRGARIGSTVFELDRLTAREVHHLNDQDYVCVPTAWAVEVLGISGVTTPTHILHHGVDRSIFNEGVPPAFENPTNATVFINVSKIEYRKGHDFLADAFSKAFTKKDNVQLIMSWYNPFLSESDHMDWYSLYKNSPLGDKITIIDKKMPSQHNVASLLRGADCALLVSRAEGWGLLGLETLSCGRRLIATNCSGQTEYLTHDNSLLIEMDATEDAYDGVFFKDTEHPGKWAEFGYHQLDQLVSYMRATHKEKQQYGARPLNLAGIETAKQFSWANAVSSLTQFLEKVA